MIEKHIMSYIEFERQSYKKLYKKSSNDFGWTSNYIDVVMLRRPLQNNTTLVSVLPSKLISLTG